MKIGGLFLGLFICLFTITAKAGISCTPKVGVTDVQNLLINYRNLNDNNLALNKLQLVLDNLTKKQRLYKNEKYFVERLYYYTHRKLLKKYNQYASLSTTLVSGEYDCLTATAIYSILLNELSIPHAVVETNYHIYILVYPDTQAEILLETTDPNYGFITSTSTIEQLKSKYRTTNGEQAIGQADLEINIERRLEGKEIIGLLYYNQSVKELNQGNLQVAEELANLALKFYPAIRVSTLVEFIDTSYRSVSL